MPPKNFEDIDWDEYYGCDDDDTPLGVWAAEMKEQKEQEEDEGEEENEDDNRTVYEHTDCAGDGDTIRIDQATGAADALLVWINDSQMVILRDDEVNALMSALLEWQEARDDG